MSAQSVAEREARRLLEYQDPAQIAAEATVRGGVPLKQRGRTGRVTAFDPSKHPRGEHGRFAPGNHAGQKASAAKATPRTPEQIKQFQKQYGLAQTGQLDGATRATMKAPPPQTVEQMHAKEKAAEAKAKASKRSSRSKGKTAATTAERNKLKAEEKKAHDAGEQKKAEQIRAKIKALRSTRSSRSSRSTRSSGGSSTSASTRASTRAATRLAGQESASAWTGKLGGTEPLTVGKGMGKGEKPSPAVALLQSKLVALGYTSGTAADGKFGPATDAAVRVLQREYHLPVTGKVDTGTIALIESLVERAQKWQAQGIIAAEHRPDESAAALARAVVAVLA